MNDADCTALLQWALPRLSMRWAGFRRVRGQVCKRLRRRMADLGLRDPADYRALLKTHPEEWTRLDGLCRISISRFYRDQGVWRMLERGILPDLIEGGTDARRRPAADLERRLRQRGGALYTGPVARIGRGAPRLLAGDPGHGRGPTSPRARPPRLLPGNQPAGCAGQLTRRV